MTAPDAATNRSRRWVVLRSLAEALDLQPLQPWWIGLTRILLPAGLMLTLPSTLRLTPAQFAEVCATNPEAVLEREADGTLLEMTPTGGSTGARNARLISQLQAWADAWGGWIVLASSTGFLLPDGSIRSPDVCVVRRDRWQTLSEAERDGFPPLCGPANWMDMNHACGAFRTMPATVAV